MKENKKDERTRNWCFIIYPSSMPKNAFDILDNLHTPIAISPLHNKGLKKDGEEIKSHYHVIITFKGKKSKEQVEELIKEVNGTKVQPVNNLDGYIRYLIHKDNPEKQQFKKGKEAITLLGGMNIEEAFNTIQAEEEQLAYIMDIINIYNIDNLVVLIHTLKKANHEEMIRLIMNKRLQFVKAYLLAKWQLNQRKVKHIIEANNTKGKEKGATTTAPRKVNGQRSTKKKETKKKIRRPS